MKKSFTLTISQDDDGLTKATMEYDPPLLAGADDGRAYFATIAFAAVTNEMDRLEYLQSAVPEEAGPPPARRFDCGW